MTITMSRWVLWVSLIIVAPMPLLSQGAWHWVPVFRVVQLLWRTLLPASAESVLTLSIILQAGLGALLLGGLAFTYGIWSSHWPAKIRGSVMSLMLFVSLILLASVPAYRPLVSSAEPLLTFMRVYH